MLMVIVEEYSDTFKNRIIDLILDIQNHEFNIQITADQQPDLSAIEQYYQHGNGNFWVATSDDKLVGTIALLDIGSRQVALRKMFVHRAYRGKKTGLSSLLLGTAVTWSRAKKIREIFLGTTSTFIAAHRFYEKNHFQEIKKEKLPDTFPLMEVDTKFYKKYL